MDQSILDEMEFLADTLLYYEYERMGRKFLAYLWLKHLARQRLEILTGPGVDQLD